MHSYDNGNALKAKRDNWNQLLKVFRKIGLPHLITEEEADFILRCEDNAAVNFITKIYEVLTQRKIQTQVKKPTVGRQAGYTKETGAWKVREALRKNDLREDSDQLLVTKKASSVVEDHEKTLQEERSLDPDRFSIATSIGLKSLNVVPKSMVDTDSELPQVRVKEIQVRQLDRNVTHLRASKQMNNQGNSNMQLTPISGNKGQYPRSITPSGAKKSSDRSVFGNHPSPGERYPPAQAGMLLAENATSVINSCICRVMNSENFPGWSSDREPHVNFMHAVELQRNNISDLDHLIAEALTEIRLSSSQLADACAVTPKQFWFVSDLFCTVLKSATYESESFAAAAESFESLGRWTCQRDPTSSLAIFCDFALFKLAGTITLNAHKRLSIMRVLLSFTPDDSQARIQCIKRLQSTLPDMNVFIICLTILAAHETALDDSLMDLYLYYGTIGLGLPSPKLRAAATSVFFSLLPQANGVVTAMVPQLLQMAKEETWWEVHAHLLSICGVLLEQISARGDPATDAGSRGGGEANTSTATATALDQLKEMVAVIFSPSAPKNIRLWGVGALVPGLPASEDVASLYLRVLMTLDPADRKFFLDVRDDSGDRTKSAGGREGSSAGGGRGRGREKDVIRMPLPSSTGIPFVLEPVVVRWQPLPVARAIEATVQSSELDRLEPEAMEILNTCAKSIVDAFPDEEAPMTGGWLEVYSSLKDYIFVGLCDQDSCMYSASILKFYLTKSKLRESILKEVRFIGILRLLYPEMDDGNPICQEVFEDFVRDVFMMEEPYNLVITGLIEQFAKSFTAQYEKSNLPDLLKEFISDY